MAGEQKIEILLAEDEEEDIEATREALKESKLHNNLHVVNNGEDLLNYLRKIAPYENAVCPDVILLDINMPGKNGLEVLKEIKNDPKLKTIPVAMLTCSAAEEDILRSYVEHANCYIRKPVSLQEFEKVVQAIEHFWFSIVTLPPKRR